MLAGNPIMSHCCALGEVKAGERQLAYVPQTGICELRALRKAQLPQARQKCQAVQAAV